MPNNFYEDSVRKTESVIFLNIINHTDNSFELYYRILQRNFFLKFSAHYYNIQIKMNLL